MGLKSDDRCLYKFCWSHMGHQASPTASRNWKRQGMDSQSLRRDPAPLKLISDSGPPGQYIYTVLSHSLWQFVNRSPRTHPPVSGCSACSLRRKDTAGHGDLHSIRASPCPHLPAGILYARAPVGARDQRSPSPGTVFIRKLADRSFCKPGCLSLPVRATRHRAPLSRLMLNRSVFIRTSCQRPSSVTSACCHRAVQPRSHSSQAPVL